MNRFSKRRAALLGAIALVPPLVAACGTAGPQAARAIEEAKQVTAEFTATPWAPPPRTLGDVTAILDQQRLADPEGVARARARADQRPPATGDADALARFYHRTRSTGRSPSMSGHFRSACGPRTGEGRR
ncbi:MAG: hypothetical protein HYU25_06670 [Candidatus Rokubacteria bacterium]|nr:hypothetical protein [Candidatus Rokubacteria bacterium]